MSDSLTCQNLGSGGFSNNHNGSLDVTCGKIGVDTAINDELKEQNG
jgi:hypothetical protein